MGELIFKVTLKLAEKIPKILFFTTPIYMLFSLVTFFMPMKIEKRDTWFIGTGNRCSKIYFKKIEYKLNMLQFFCHQTQIYLF